MAPMNLGVIGCGNMARQHMVNAVKAKDLKLVAYADVVEDAAKKFHADYGGVYHTTNAKRVFADDRVDAVLIATHHNSHRALAVAAAKAGKHILLEKPMALTNGDCARIAEAVDKAGVVFMMGFKLRFCPLVQRLHAVMPNPKVTVGQMIDGTWREESWAHNKVTGGGNVLSQGCHTVDLLYYLHQSEPVAVYAGGGSFNHDNTPDVIDTTVATIEYANGSVSSWVQGDPQQNTFVSKFFLQAFDRGSAVSLQSRFHDGVHSQRGQQPALWSVEKEMPGADAEGTAQELEEFIACVSAGKQPKIGASVKDGVRATALILAAFESVRTGRLKKLKP